MVEVVIFDPEHAQGISEVCRGQGWPTYADPTVALRGCTAAGSCVAVALDGDLVVGFAQAFGDGFAQSFLSQLVVRASHRRQGIARRLVQVVHGLTGAERMDLVTSEDSRAFYESFTHKQMVGVRLYPIASAPG